MTVHVVVVGQTPPPVHGQAVMVEALMRMHEPGIELHLVRLGFSESLADVGRVQLGKLLELLSVVRSIGRVRRETGATVLYLAVGGASLVPLMRDVLLLLVTRTRFRRVVLHIHGAGVGSVLARLPSFLRWGLRLMMGRPDVVIELTPDSPSDGVALRARRIVVVSNGIPDEPAIIRQHTGPMHVVFLGTLRESKGVLALIRAVGVLRTRDVQVGLELVGLPVDEAFATSMSALVDTLGLSTVVTRSGQLDGAAKRDALERNDVFAFPSDYAGENQSVAVMEAMRAGLPVVAADWRGAKTQVEHGVSGLLVPPGDDAALVEALASLAADPAARAAMGAAGRARFERDYTERAFHVAMARVLSA